MDSKEQDEYIAQILSTEPEIAIELEQARELSPSQHDATEPLSLNRQTTSQSIISPDSDISIKHCIGAGGMGQVYLAEAGGREVALKVLSSGHRLDTTIIKRFRREQNTLKQLKHPNIVEIFSIAGDNSFFTMEYVAGPSLTNWRATARDEDITPKRIAQIMLQIADAVSYANALGVIHRDLKPSNVLITQDEDAQPKARLIDFGIATSADATLLTQTGQAMGTVDYMAPECLLPGKEHKPSETIDVYGLGGILYFLITGRGPYDSRATTKHDLLHILRNPAITPAPPGRDSKHCDEKLETLCLRCLAKYPSDRYQTTREVYQDLQRYLAGDSILARVDSLGKRVNRYARRNSLPIVITSVSTVLAIVMSALFLSAYVQGRKNERMVRYLLQSQDSQIRVLDSRELLGNPASLPVYSQIISVFTSNQERISWDDIGRANAISSVNHLLEIAAIAEKVGLPEQATKCLSLVDDGLNHFGEPNFNDDAWTLIASKRWTCGARVLQAQNQFGEAAECGNKAVGFHQRLQNPHNIEARRSLAKSLSQLSRTEFLRWRRGENLANASKPCVKEIAILQEIYDQSSLESDGIALARAYGRLALITYKGGPIPEQSKDNSSTVYSVDDCSQAGLEVLEGLEEPESVEAMLVRCSLQNTLGMRWASDTETLRAVELHQSNIDIFRRLVADRPMVLQFRVSLARSLGNLADAYMRHQMHKENATARSEAFELLHELITDYGYQQDLNNDISVHGIRLFCTLNNDLGEHENAIRVANLLLNQVKDPGVYEPGNLLQRVLAAQMYAELAESTDDRNEAYAELASQYYDDALDLSIKASLDISSYLQKSEALQRLARDRGQP